MAASLLDIRAKMLQHFEYFIDPKGFLTKHSQDEYGVEVLYTGQRRDTCTKQGLKHMMKVMLKTEHSNPMSLRMSF